MFGFFHKEGKNVNDDEQSYLQLRSYVNSQEDNIFDPEVYDKAQNNDPAAQVRIAQYYKDIEGNLNEAMRLLKKAADQKFGPAYTELGYIYRNKGKKDQARDCFEKALKYGDAEGAYAIASEQEYADQNFKEAFKYYKIAAEMGDADAQAKTGLFLLNGKGTEKNESIAFSWMKKAVDQENYRIAGYCLARCYLNGIGTEKNEVKGFEILRNTALAGYDEKTVELLILCYEKGIGTAKSRKNAGFWKRIKDEQNGLMNELVNEILEEKDF